VDVRAGIGIGRDDNARLDSGRKGDAFLQESASVGWRKRTGDNSRLRVFYDVFNVNYFEVTDQSFLWQGAGAGYDVALTPETAVQFDYTLEWLYFPDNESVGSHVNEGRIGLLRRFYSGAYVKAGIGLSERQFADNKRRDGAGLLSGDDERTDRRVGGDAEIGFLPIKTLLVRLGGSIYNNDSDDAFHDFYDYRSVSSYATATLRITAKLFAFFKAGIENQAFHSRPLLDAPGSEEDSDLYTGTLAIFYRLRENITLSLTQNYREKVSNEPSREHSGSISTLGLLYSF